MSAAATQQYRVDDVVGVDDPKRPGRWRVKSAPKGRQVNYRLSPAEGQSDRDLMCPAYMLTAPPEPSATHTRAGMSIGVPFRERYQPGQVVVCIKPVVIKGAQGGSIEGKLLVVLDDKGERVNCIEIGGRGGLYYRLNPATVQAVDIDDLLGRALTALNSFLAPDLAGVPGMPDNETERAGYEALRDAVRATLRTERGD